MNFIQGIECCEGSVITLMGIFICHDQILTVLSSDEEINLSKPNDFKSLIDP